MSTAIPRICKGNDYIKDRHRTLRSMMSVVLSILRNTLWRHVLGQWHAIQSSAGCPRGQGGERKSNSLGSSPWRLDFPHSRCTCGDLPIRRPSDAAIRRPNRRQLSMPVLFASCADPCVTSPTRPRPEGIRGQSTVQPRAPTTGSGQHAIQFSRVSFPTSNGCCGRGQ